MIYILLNRKNVVVDIVENLRYIKLQSSTGIVIGCEEREATGIAGSINYVLDRADMNNDENAVHILSLEEVPSTVIVNYSVFNPETNEFESRYTLEEIQAIKQEENKQLFAEYLSSHPLTWVDGKTYGVTEQDQSEIALNINQYQIAVQAGIDTPTLEWHAQHEECYPWTLEKLSGLSLAISQFVYPIYHKMQQFKTSVYSATTEEEVKNIKINYEEVESTE